MDTWAFCSEDENEHLSMSHSRSALYKLWFGQGDTLVTNRFRAILKIINDTSPGKHDTLHAACSPGSYEFYGAGENHPNCEANLLNELKKRDCSFSAIPDPWNLFEHAHVNPDMSLQDKPASARPGDYIELEALTDLMLICSACPSTVGSISGSTPKGAAIQL